LWLAGHAQAGQRGWRGPGWHVGAPGG
jgi:hypothetical protein